MNRAGPPEKKAAWEGLNPTRHDHQNRNVAQHLADWPTFRNHRIVEVKRALTPSQWIELRWRSLTAEFFAEWRASA
jgi:hypothetical protein